MPGRRTAAAYQSTDKGQTWSRYDKRPGARDDHVGWHRTTKTTNAWRHRRAASGEIYGTEDGGATAGSALHSSGRCEGHLFVGGSLKPDSLFRSIASAHRTRRATTEIGAWKDLPLLKRSPGQKQHECGDREPGVGRDHDAANTRRSLVQKRNERPKRQRAEARTAPKQQYRTTRRPSRRRGVVLAMSQQAGRTQQGRRFVNDGENFRHFGWPRQITARFQRHAERDGHTSAA